MVVALVIMLVMSIIGISNMQSSTLQERMAANTRQKAVAKYAAESALNVAEKWLSENVKGIYDIAEFDGSDGLYSAVKFSSLATVSPSSKHISDLQKAEAWGDITAFTENTPLIDEKIVSKQPQFIIEYIGRDYRGSANKVIATDNLSKLSDAFDSKPFFFRITAIGWGRDTNIYTVLESIYKTGSSEYFDY